MPNLKEIQRKLDRLNSLRNSNLSESKKAAVKRYRELAQLEEGAKIDKIDEWALKKACNQYAVPLFDLKPILLRENMRLDEDIVDKTARETNAEVVDAEEKDEIEKELDICLADARTKQSIGEEEDFPNLIIEGVGGIGKTAIVKQWAKKNNINLYVRNAASMTQEAVGGLVGYDPDDPNFVKELINKSFYKGLSRPNTVLFLDEYNRVRQNVRNFLMTVINEHEIPGGEEGSIKLPNLLFTVMAINPVSPAYPGTDALDSAEKTRGMYLPTTPNPFSLLKYLNSFYTDRIKKLQAIGNTEEAKKTEGRKQLANTILKDPRFEITPLSKEEKMVDDPDFKATNFRSFKELLDKSDGTKEDFLKRWPAFCDYTQKKTIEDILKNYKDIDDKANDALKQGSKSKVFQKTLSNWEKVQQLINEM